MGIVTTFGKRVGDRDIPAVDIRGGWYVRLYREKT